jgi:tryptophan halogenase
VGVVGGGAAGYLAALALRARRPAARVTLIEAPDLPPLGVGEATTPLLPQFLHADLGIAARDLFAAVHPTFKLGIRFAWGDPRGAGFPYPFGPVRTLEAKAWDGDLEACSLQALHMAAGTLPVVPAAPRGPAGENVAAPRAAFGTEIAYHLDSARFAAFLGRLAEARGVEVVRARIAHVVAAPDGASVEALAAADGRRFAFDLYLDCSGFRSLLMGEALGSPWVDYSGSLFTDRALVGRSPHGGRLAPNTRAETLDAGWCWSIPQEEADHVGYVYGSAFTTAERAAEELARHRPGVSGLRELAFRPGRRRHFWRGNVVALGNAYGFVEPLESTSLHLLIRQIGLLLRALPREGPPPRAERATPELLNRRVGAFWDYVRWFLALHFRFNGRSGSPFWTACRAEADVSSHGEILELFRERGPLAYQPAVESVFDFPDPLWGPPGVDVILLGQDVPAPLPRPAWPREAWRGHVRRARSVAAGSMTQAAVLAALADRPEALGSLLDSLEAGFRERGPAF